MGGGGLHPKSTTLQLGTCRHSCSPTGAAPGLGSAPRGGQGGGGGGGGSSLGFVNKNIYFAFYRCLYRTAQSLRWARAGPTRSGGGGAQLWLWGHQTWGFTQTRGGARAGEECIEAFQGVCVGGGGAETFILHQLPQGLDPPGGGTDWSLGLNPSRGGGKWLQRETQISPPSPPPSSGEHWGSVCVVLPGRGLRSHEGGGRALCYREEGGTGQEGPPGLPPQSRNGVQCRVRPGPGGVWDGVGGGEQRAQP